MIKTLPLNPVDQKKNEDACANLQPGKYYTFNPPVTATGIPVGKNFKPQELNFARGWYLGFREGNHVFQGKPVEPPLGVQKKLSECYFHVAFIGGSHYEEDKNQKPD